MVDQIWTSKSIRLVGNAHVTELIANQNAATIVGARVVTPVGRTIDVRANRFVLAAGGIENTRLLLELDDATTRSNSPRWPALGHMFMERPHGIVGFIIPTKDFTGRAGNYQLHEPTNRQKDDGASVRSKWHIVPSTTLLKNERLAGFALSFYPAEPDWLPDDLNQLAQRCSNTVTTKQGPRPGFTPSASWPSSTPTRRVTYVLAHAKISAAYASGHCTPATARRPSALPQHAATGLAPPACTTIHSLASSTTTVGATAWPTSTVASTSVFPTSGSYNPTMTLLALSLRLADHLKENS